MIINDEWMIVNDESKIFNNNRMIVGDGSKIIDRRFNVGYNDDWLSLRISLQQTKKNSFLVSKFFKENSL